MRFEMRQAAIGPETDKLMGDGWEPFDVDGAHVWLKRAGRDDTEIEIEPWVSAADAVCGAQVARFVRTGWDASH